MAGNVSFDVVSEFDRQELVNAIDQVRREVATRFDFKGAKVQIDLTEKELVVVRQREERSPGLRGKGHPERGEGDTREGEGRSAIEGRRTGGEPEVGREGDEEEPHRLVGEDQENRRDSDEERASAHGDTEEPELQRRRHEP